MKLCRACGEWKPPDAFSPKGKKCRDCRRRENRAYHERHRDRLLPAMRLRWQRRIDRLTEGLTPRERQVFDYIRSRKRQPSYDDIRADCGIKHYAQVSAIVGKLVGRGMVRILPRRIEAVSVRKQKNRPG